MMLEEFNDYIDAYNMDAKRPNTDEYKLIEYVYTNHPCNMSKRQAAVIWCEFGIPIFKEMEQLAKRWSEIDNRIHTHKLAIEELKQDKKTLEEVYTCVE